MVQVLDKVHENKYSLILKEIIIIEELPMEAKQIEHSKIFKREKPKKRSLLKLFNKAKYNANYLKETKQIENVKSKLNFRNYAVY